MERKKVVTMLVSGENEELEENQSAFDEFAMTPTAKTTNSASKIRHANFNIKSNVIIIEPINLNIINLI